jgi:hypothetical protein
MSAMSANSACALTMHHEAVAADSQAVRLRMSDEDAPGKVAVRCRLRQRIIIRGEGMTLHRCTGWYSHTLATRTLALLLC